MLNPVRITSLFILVPFLFYPFFFCPFRLPYLYCFICPLRCGYSRIRGIVLLIALGLNLKKGLFCTHICPLGSIQTLLYKIKSPKLSLPHLLLNLKYVGLVLVVFVLLITALPQLLSYKIAPFGHFAPFGYFAGLSFSQIFVLKMGVLLLGILLLGMALGVFSYRFFCSNLCPLKALSIILQRLCSRRKVSV